uniref:intramembrane prenyl-peptidase Rce1 n=1 Tax=Arcella intermedia TaxID=1963864 RepID=A0A6B2LES3_9EUKA
MICTGYSLMFVLSLYVWEASRQRYGRDNPLVIKQRFFSVFCVCLVSFIINYFLGFHPKQLGISLDISGVHAAFTGLLVTLILFFGPLVQLGLHWHEESIPDLRDLAVLRNLVVGPFAEEFFFRAMMLPLLVESGFSMILTTVISMGLFALAHVHHYYHSSLGRVLFQMFYTSLFGAFSSFLFLRTGNWLAPFVSHAFCNYMGFPQVNPKDPYFKIICVSYVLGLLGFLSFSMTLTDPCYHNSIFFKDSCPAQ